MPQVYLDHAATTPLFTEVVEIMTEFLRDHFGNPSSLHSFGREAKVYLKQAHEDVAALINADAEDIFFTSGGTESDNLAILGSAALSTKKHLITSSVEHRAVLDACEHLRRQGFDLTILDVDQYGMVQPAALKKALREDTFLVTIMHANNEVGTINPIKELCALAHQAGALFHVDAVQSAGKIEVDVNDWDVDMLTYSSHKINGPKGVGALYKRKDLPLQRLVFGGEQEQKVRSGTENMPGIVGFGKAASLTRQNWRRHSAECQKLRDLFLHKALENIPQCRLNGHPTARVPHNVNLSFNNIDGAALLMQLDMGGVACSAGSACAAGDITPSHVLQAMKLDEHWQHSAVRFTFGHGVNEEDTHYAAQVLQEKVELLRKMSSAGQY